MSKQPSTYSRHALSLRNIRGGPLQRLPAELVMTIFEMTRPASWPSGLILSAVCRRWKNIIDRNRPRYWAYLRVYVGPTNPTSLVDLAAQLAISGMNSIRIEVVTRNVDQLRISPRSIRVEQARVCAIVSVLKPHFHRCISLSFNLLHRSSLPSVLDDIGVCPHLKRLILKCRDGTPNDHDLILRLSNPHPQTVFGFGQLKYLAIDGPNFVRVSMYAPGWLRNQPFNDESFVSISHFWQSEWRFPFFLYHALLELQYTVSISLDNVVLPFRHGLMAEDGFGRSNLDPTLNLCNYALSFANIDNADFIREVFFVDSRPLGQLKIANCPFDAFDENALDNVQTLWLDGCNSRSELFSFFREWEGNNLVLKNCEGFNDRLIKKLCNIIIAEQNEDSCPLFWVTHLELIACRNFSLGCLKELLVALRIAGQERLVLRVAGLPFPSNDDIAWFRRHTVELYWSVGIEPTPGETLRLRGPEASRIVTDSESGSESEPDDYLTDS
ncbi:hypothetical protein Hypma_005907 [Hypsizygus marmoreus]|uniref:F-box domain-containing protein n=1 Tax=Hypsizygus marmoreus TaxID=39966 RepID=A0A369KCT1_HYPMA|nr:hypothetical protein Hypma_005907 [Hypsizygus marmoreus]